MDPRQSVVSPMKHSFVVLEPENTKKPSNLSGDVGFNRKKTDSGDFTGVLDVYIHQARDIHNICIYHKQDVYAKVSLTSDPNESFSTKIINGGGKNPVFNESLRVNVRTIESSLKCEVWMLSRIKNYLQDQLLGFALVPLVDVLVGSGKLSQEFSLSSTELLHSPAGFVELSLSYDGVVPEVLVIPRLDQSRVSRTELQDSEIPDSASSDYDKMEFPDPKTVKENHKMVSEYFGIPCNSLDSESSECLNTPESDNHPISDLGVKVVESFSATSFSSDGVLKSDTPVGSVLTDGSPSAPITSSSQSFSNNPGASNPSSHLDLVSPGKDKDGDNTEAGSGVVLSNKFGKSVLTVNIEPEQAVMQQEIVDMYMKSMQQFTESLAKMKLPMDIENGTKDLGNTNSSSDQKSNTSKANGSRVFYGSRAFF